LENPSNAYVRDVFERGDLQAGFGQADLIIENTFTVPRVHQGFLEPHCCLVYVDDQNRVQVWSPNKVPYGLKQSLSTATGIAPESIRVNPVSIGGDFGGKRRADGRTYLLFSCAAHRQARKDGDGVSGRVVGRRSKARRCY
jgi:CO/xanthine dehydrogenase Mo-binding subunit